jgi:menaquinol-cytochrome c reductase iron-sulfur subunit
LDERPGDDRPQLPTPSLWPVGFAVGIVCLLVGLIISWPVAAIGAAIAAVFGFLWAREVTTGRQPTVASDGAGAPETDGAPPIPAHEGEAAMPAPEPGERFPRNKFLEGATLGIGAIIGAIVTLPALAAALVPGFVKQGGHKVDLGPVDNFENGQYYIATFTRNAEQGKVSRMSAFIRNNGTAQDGSPSFTCISNRCVHLGCPVQAGGPTFSDKQKTVKSNNGPIDLIPALPAAGFICPCHGGAYDQEGNRIAGPPVRALNRFEFAIVDGHLVLGSMFSVSKVDGSGGSAKIHKYELAGPGQHIDGPEAWLYPLQPPH